MKALTLRQPWASLIDLQAKRIETRSWWTDYRGELVVHASREYPWTDLQEAREKELRKALAPKYTPESVPRGVALCVVRIFACVKTTEVDKLKAVGFPPVHVRELLFGNFQPGRWAWVLEYVRHLNHEPEIKGALGLWEFPDRLLVDPGENDGKRVSAAVPADGMHERSVRQGTVLQREMQDYRLEDAPPEGRGPAA